MAPAVSAPKLICCGGRERRQNLHTVLKKARDHRENVLKISPG